MFYKQVIKRSPTKRNTQVMKGSGTWDFQYYTAGHLSHLMTTTVSATLGSACVFAYYGRKKRCHKALVCKTERTIHHINTPDSSSLTEQTVTLTFWSSVNSELLCWDCASFCRCLANLGKGGENRRVRTQHNTEPCRRHHHHRLLQVCQQKGSQTAAPKGFFFTCMAGHTEKQNKQNTSQTR